MSVTADSTISALGLALTQSGGTNFNVAAGKTLTVSGNIITAERNREQGMVADFSDLKQLVHATIVEPWDHAFLAYAEDRVLVDFLATLPAHRTVLFDAPPTAEHLAAVALKRLTDACERTYGGRVRVAQVRIYETPNCWADALASE